MRDFTITRVVTRDILRDSFNTIRNTFGLRLRNFEDRINKNSQEMLEEMRLTYNVKWYRMNFNPLVTGSVMIVIYGEENVI